MRLGDGSFGTVYLAINTENPSEVLAVKKEACPSDRECRIQKEFRLSKEAGGLMRDQVFATSSPESSEPGEKFAYTLMDRIQYNLMDAVNDTFENFESDTKITVEKFLAEFEKSFGSKTEIMAQLEGKLIEDLKKGISHRDIKPENIGKKKDGTWTFLDYGIAQQLKPSKLQEKRLIESGTPAYAILGQERSAIEHNAFSLYVTFIECGFVARAYKEPSMEDFLQPDNLKQVDEKEFLAEYQKYLKKIEDSPEFKKFFKEIQERVLDPSQSPAGPATAGPGQARRG